MFRPLVYMALGAGLVGLGTSPAPVPTLTPVALQCESGTNPQGIDVVAPRLSWQVASPIRAQRQSAWQVLVATSDTHLDRDTGDLWDSGRVENSETLYHPYAGRPLSSSQRVYWKVRVWDARGQVSPWSRPASWTMGLLTTDEWRGQWIAAPAATETLRLRHEFVVGTGLRRAVVHVSGLGQYELTLNGRRVGDDLLTPAWTNYARTSVYDTYDVTALLREGSNAAGMFLGNGMYHVVRRHRFAKFTGSFGPLRAIVHLRLEYADGRVDVVGSSPAWRTHAGPVTYASIYGGEDYDARLEEPGWDEPGFDARGWQPAVPVIRLEDVLRGYSAMAEPIRVIERRTATRLGMRPDGTEIYDIGQNASFMPDIRVVGPAGSTVRLTPAEVLNANGTIDRRTMGSAARGSSWWQYTKATDHEERWAPRFYYVGSRYVQVERFAPGEVPTVQVDAAVHERPRPTNTTALPAVTALEIRIIHSTASPAGSFGASDPTYGRIRDLVRWAQRSNMMSIITDCPHREKLGWIEQLHLNGPSLRFEFTTSRLFAKAMRDMAEGQTSEGLVPNVAPEYVVFAGPFRAAAEWGASFVLVPWQQYLFTGDLALLQTHYGAIQRYVAYLESRTRDGILEDGLGDWYDIDLAVPGRANLTPPSFTATAYLYLNHLTLAAIAERLGHAADAAISRTKAARTRTRFNETFYHPEDRSYATRSQATYAIPVALGLADPAHHTALVDGLVRDIERRGYCTAGDVGFGAVLRVLADAGRQDVVGTLLRRTDTPGYGYQLAAGNTSLAEAWDANRGVSQNHFILGQVIEWFYQDLVGIVPQADGEGFRRIVIRPRPVEGLTWAEATYQSVRGPVAVRWDREGSRFTLRVTIPANSTARIELPSRIATAILESGRPAAGQPGVTVREQIGDRRIVEVSSGSYTLASTW